MLASQAHSFTQQARLAITLAWIAGCTNILTLLTCQTATSHVTGTASNLAIHVVGREWAAAAFAVFLLMAFLIGAATSGALIEIGRRRGWESIYVLPMLTQAILLLAFSLEVELFVPHGRLDGAALWMTTGIASAAMGLQNATITRISGGVVRTTHLTGVLTDLGSELAVLLIKLRDVATRQHRRTVRQAIAAMRSSQPVRRLALLASIIGSFCLGGAVGAFSYQHLARYSMLPPVAFLLWIIWQDIRTPICEIEPAERPPAPAIGTASRDADADGSLPDSLAVFHVRGSVKRGVRSRFPDLLRWCERLPAERRVIVLDLGEVPQLDANAAMELHAVAKQAHARSRTIVLAGIDEPKYRTLRSTGTDIRTDLLFADLDLAVAHALNVAKTDEAARWADEFAGR
jgi:uncharacterized membrane protein YoaK (UPF0700 family)/anti-anti-sigma regulatory factor